MGLFPVSTGLWDTSASFLSTYNSYVRVTELAMEELSVECAPPAYSVLVIAVSVWDV